MKEIQQWDGNRGQVAIKRATAVHTAGFTDRIQNAAVRIRLYEPTTMNFINLLKQYICREKR